MFKNETRTVEGALIPCRHIRMTGRLCLLAQLLVQGQHAELHLLLAILALHQHVREIGNFDGRFLSAH